MVRGRIAPDRILHIMLKGNVGEVLDTIAHDEEMRGSITGNIYRQHIINNNNNNNIAHDDER